MDGETRDYPDRDVREVTFGKHKPWGAIYFRYERTIDRSCATARTVFRYAGYEVFPNTPTSSLRRLILRTGRAKPAVKVIGSPV